MKKLLNLIPNTPWVDRLIVYLTSIFFFRSFTFYFGITLNAYILRSKTQSAHLSNFVDKLEAKAFIGERVGSAHVVQTLGVWGENDVPSSPQWVFKSNNNFDGALIFKDGLIRDVKGFLYRDPVECRNLQHMSQVLERFALTPRLRPERVTRETCYQGIEQKFFFEELVQSTKPTGGSPDEYKFHMINGEVAFIYIVLDRENLNKRVIVDATGEILPFSWCKPRDAYKYDIAYKPELSGLFSEMKDAAKKLANGFKYVRVDVYDAEPFKVGELTFYHGSGLEQITPVIFDKKFGELLRG